MKCAQRTVRRSHDGYHLIWWCIDELVERNQPTLPIQPSLGSANFHQLDQKLLYLPSIKKVKWDLTLIKKIFKESKAISITAPVSFCTFALLLLPISALREYFWLFLIELLIKAVLKLLFRPSLWTFYITHASGAVKPSGAGICVYEKVLQFSTKWIKLCVKHPSCLTRRRDRMMRGKNDLLHCTNCSNLGPIG